MGAGTVVLNGYGDGYGSGNGKEYWSAAREEGTLSYRHVLMLENAELRREIAEMLGPERMFKNAEAVHSDTDGHGKARQLLDIAMPDTKTGHLRAVEVTCPSTQRRFLLPVPSSVSTCQEAIAATFGMQPEQYAPEIET
jgi:hypothetical protein